MSTQWHRVASVDEIDADEPLGVDIAGYRLAVFKVGDDFYATDNICTHAFAELSGGFVDGDTVECPLHQARFHIPSGKCTGPPASEDLKTYPVRVEGSDILVGVPPS